MRKLTILKYGVLLLITSILVYSFVYTDYNPAYELRKIEPNKVIYNYLKQQNPSLNFKSLSCFKYIGTETENSSILPAKLSISLKLNKEQLNQIIDSKESNLELIIPQSENTSIALQLTLAPVLRPDFKAGIINQNGKKDISFEDGLHYRGIIKGDEESFVSVSFFRKNVMGVICNKLGNYVLGALKDENRHYTNNYVFYNDKELIIKNNFVCGVGENNNTFNLKHPRENYPLNPRTTQPVGVYFVGDYQMYLDNGSSVLQTQTYITALMNEVATLYQRDSLPVVISRIDVYNAPDPYVNLSTSEQILTAFGGNTKDDFNGDLAHLLSTGHGSALGGIAWIKVLCQSYDPSDKSGRFAFSNIENVVFPPYPLYSWNVFVVSHEMGHNFGSQHTHSCVWPVLPGGGIGAIDSCVTAEGNCFTQTQRNDNGTLMGYCHLNGHVNLANGFGPLPGDTVRLCYRNATCLDSALNSSEQPLVFDLSQNYPNPFNPVTKIRFEVPSNSVVTLKVFDISGREVSILTNRFYSTGVYSVNFSAADYNLSSGLYFYRLEAKNGNNILFNDTKKMVLIK